MTDEKIIELKPSENLIYFYWTAGGIGPRICRVKDLRENINGG